jgi:hypothetical protein
MRREQNMALLNLQFLMFEVSGEQTHILFCELI